MGNEKLQKASEELLEIKSIINEVGTTRKIKRALLREKFGFTDELLDEVLPMDKEFEDY